MVNKCLQCYKKFTPRAPHHLFCSRKCCNAYNIGKTWESYFKKLIQKTQKRRNLTVPMLIKILEKQEGLCALSGVPLTRITGHGNISTNASIDRIKSGGPYTKSNIRLVCNCVNSFRGTLTDKEFRFWCRKVVEHG